MHRPTACRARALSRPVRSGAGGTDSSQRSEKSADADRLLATARGRQPAKVPVSEPANLALHPSVNAGADTARTGPHPSTTPAGACQGHWVFGHGHCLASLRMLLPRFHHDAPSPAHGGSPSHSSEGEGSHQVASEGSRRADWQPMRLSLLLGYAGWREHTWADSLPALLTPMGITAYRATSGRQASAIIEQTPIHIAVVDLGLPLDDSTPPHAESTQDQAGPRLLEILRRLPQPPPTVVIKRTRSARDDRREVAAALKLGAFAVIDPPRTTEPTAARSPSTGDLEVFLEVLRRILYRHYQGRWPTAAGPGHLPHPSYTPPTPPNTA